MRSTRESAVGLIDEGIDFQIDTASIARLVGQVSNFLEPDFWGVSEVSLVRSARPSGYKRLCNEADVSAKPKY
jgi:hypothetical protein